MKLMKQKEEQFCIQHLELQKLLKFLLMERILFLKYIVLNKKLKTSQKAIVNGNSVGYSGKPFTDVVNIGIGGSDLGPAMVVDSLQFYKNHLKTHFVSNVDGDHVSETIKKLNPETTLFVIVSKTFTTQETLSNANTLRSWFLEHAPKEAIAKHFVAVSTNIEKVKAFWNRQKIIFFPMWNWVGGRFSLWSSSWFKQFQFIELDYNNFNRVIGLEVQMKWTLILKYEAFSIKTFLFFLACIIYLV